jgi:amino acid adenylation domain-containing protein
MDERARSAVRQAVETLAVGVEADVAQQERSALIAAGVTSLLAAVTDQPIEAITPDRPLLLESLQAAHLQAVLDAGFGVSLPLADLAAGVSVAAVSQLLLTPTVAAAPSADSSASIDPAARHQPFDLTDVQQAYLLGREYAHELGNVDAAFYVELATLDLDIDRFERAFRAAVARHDMLRAVVTEDGRMRVLETVPDYTITRADLTGVPNAEQRSWLEALRAELTGTRRDVASWPLFDVRATTLDEHRGLLHIGIDLLVCDGASFARLMEELADRYAEPERQWPELELTFRDYLQLVEAATASDDAERARAYWLERLDQLPPAPELPLAKPLSAIEAPKFHRRHHWIPATEWQRFKARAAEFGVTPSTALAAAYTEVLAMWSRSADFTINLTVNNRRPIHREVREVLGDFTTLTLLEIHHNAGGSFAERTKAIQAQLWRDLDHRDYSAVRVMRELARRSGPAAAVAPVVFSTFVGAGFDDDFAPDWLAGLDYTLAQAPQLSLESLVLEYGGGLNLTWDTVDEAFPAGVLDDMFAAYRDLVLRLAAQDEAWQATETVSLPAAQAQAREQVNRTAGPQPRELLHRLGTALRERRPDPAVITGNRVLSYAELDRLACRLGRGLRAEGAAVNRLVAVVMDKGWEQVAAVLGILHSGAAYLPIDAGLPPERIRRLLALGEVELVLSQKAVLDRLDWPDNVNVFAVDDDGLWADYDDSPPVPAQTSEDLAYVIFTSGSTGEPKGVMIDHRGAANTTLDINSRFGIGPDDRVLALSSLSFDLSVWDIFGMLAAGGAVVLPEPDAGRDPERWSQLVRQHRVTVWNTVPALMQMYVSYCEAQPTLDAIAGLRLVLMSGDWIEVTLPDRIRAQQACEIELISMGGATEASIWSVYHRIGEHDPSWKSVPYGTPLRNQTLHVLDEFGRRRPDWVTGRLYIGGIGVARGYWGDAAKTAQRFVQDQRSGERLYDTGELARYHPGGVLEFLGRDDGQVKVNGYRIELGEIEHALAAHPAVDRAVALADGNRLLSFVTTHPGHGTDGDLTSEQIAHLPSGEQIAHLASGEQIAHLASGEQIADLASGEQIADLASGEQIADLASGEQIAEWQQVFDSLRTSDAAETAGWIDTFTGRPIAEEDMQAWADVTARRVLAQQPRRILEIGCGAGLIATRVVGECVEYVGTDLSSRTLDYLRGRIQETEATARVTLLAREARDFTDLPTGHFDCVILNSVLQYFPTADYLIDTVRGALAALRPGGVLYLGDVRDLRVLAVFHAAVERAHASPDLRVRDLAWQWEQRRIAENELVVDPRLFWAGLGVPAAVLPRPGSARTEMADYRYDVLLFRRASEPLPFSATLTWLDPRSSLAELDGLLAAGVRSLRLRGIPNQRLVADAKWASLLSEPSAAALSLPEYAELIRQDSCPDEGICPDELFAVAKAAGYECEILYSADSAAGYFDAVFTASVHDLLAAIRTYASESGRLAGNAELIGGLVGGAGELTNNPLAGRRMLTLPEEIRRQAAEVLPAYMVPGKIVVLATLPLTGNGKVDVARLRGLAAGRDRAASALQDTGPRDATERALATAWQQVLGGSLPSVHDNFFLTGGDSLLAVRLVRAAAEAGITVSVDAVFSHPTLAELAALAEARPLADADRLSELPVLTPDPAHRLDPFPLTDLQQAYLLGRNGFFDLGNVAASFYIELAVEDLDVARLTGALRAVIDRHDMLRAVIGPDGRWQVRAEIDPYQVAVTDLRGIDPVRADAELARIRHETSSRIFDPASCPLFEVRVSRLDAGSRLHVSLDLLIADGGTVAAFLTELATRYAEPDRVWPELEVTFRDYHLAMAQLEESERYERAAAYWTARVSELPPAPQLPLAAEPGAVLAPHFGRLSHRLGGAAWQRLKDNAARHGLTPSAVLATAYAEVLAAWSGRAPFTLNVTINNRLPVHEQIAEVLGDFTTVTLLQVQAEHGSAFVTRVKTLQAQLARDLDHSEFSGIRMMRELARTQGAARASMPVVFTSALDSAGADFGGAVSGLGELVAGIVHTPQVHLDHQVFEYAGELVLNWDAVVELFAEADLTGMFACYVGLVERLAAEPDWDFVPAVRAEPRSAVGASQPLPGPQRPAGETASEPRAEQVLAGIWAEIFSLPKVDRNEQFAELGGDSLLALQVIAKAAAAGLSISPRDFFANPTIAGLAAVARPAVGAPAEADGSHATTPATAGGLGTTPATAGGLGTAPATAGGLGTAPATAGTALTTRQLALLAEWQQPHRHNYVLLFDMAKPLDRTALRVALRTVLRHHEGLRLAFSQGESGWSATAVPAAELPIPLTWLDLRAEPADEATQAVSRTCLQLQSELRLDEAPLFRLAYFQWPDRQQLLIVVNQLIIDNYSCRIFCADLLTAYDQVVATGEAVLPPAVSAVSWAEHVQLHAGDPAVRAELEYWRQVVEVPSGFAPESVPGSGSTDGTAMIALDSEATAALLTGASVPDILLAAVARAVGRRTGQQTVRVEVAAHGRDLDYAPLDPARIIGRLSTQWPLNAPADSESTLREAATKIGGLRARVPAAGRNYELISQLLDQSLCTAPAPVRVNYLGHADALWAPLGLSLSADHPGLLSTGEPDAGRLDILAGIVGGRLLIACTPAAADLLDDIGHDITIEFLGEPRSLQVPPEAATLRHWLGHE